MDTIPYTLSNLQTVVNLIGTVFLFFGALFIFLSFGLLIRKNWSWTLGVILFVFILIVSLGTVFIIGPSLLIEVVISFICLVYLMSLEVKSYFGRINSTFNLGNVRFSYKRESPDKKN
jgi:hypothetical protein